MVDPVLEEHMEECSLKDFELATARVLAFAKMEYGRRDGEFRLAAEAREHLEGLGVRVQYTRTRWPKQIRRAPPAADKGDRP